MAKTLDRTPLGDKKKSTKTTPESKSAFDVAESARKHKKELDEAKQSYRDKKKEADKPTKKPRKEIDKQVFHLAKDLSQTFGDTDEARKELADKRTALSMDAAMAGQVAASELEETRSKAEVEAIKAQIALIKLKEDTNKIKQERKDLISEKDNSKKKEIKQKDRELAEIATQEKKAKAWLEALSGKIGRRAQEISEQSQVYDRTSKAFWGEKDKDAEVTKESPWLDGSDLTWNDFKDLATKRNTRVEGPSSPVDDEKVRKTMDDFSKWHEDARKLLTERRQQQTTYQKAELEIYKLKQKQQTIGSDSEGDTRSLRGLMDEKSTGTPEIEEKLEKETKKYEEAKKAYEDENRKFDQLMQKEPEFAELWKEMEIKIDHDNKNRDQTDIVNPQWEDKDLLKNKSAAELILDPGKAAHRRSFIGLTFGKIGDARRFNHEKKRLKRDYRERANAGETEEAMKDATERRRALRIGRLFNKRDTTNGLVRHAGKIDNIRLRIKESIMHVDRDLDNVKQDPYANNPNTTKAWAHMKLFVLHRGDNILAVTKGLVDWRLRVGDRKFARKLGDIKHEPLDKDFEKFLEKNNLHVHFADLPDVPPPSMHENKNPIARKRDIQSLADSHYQGDIHKATRDLQRWNNEFRKLKHDRRVVETNAQRSSEAYYHLRSKYQDLYNEMSIKVKKDIESGENADNVKDNYEKMYRERFDEIERDMHECRERVNTYNESIKEIDKVNEELHKDPCARAMNRSSRDSFASRFSTTGDGASRFSATGDGATGDGTSDSLGGSGAGDGATGVGTPDSIGESGAGSRRGDPRRYDRRWYDSRYDGRGYGKSKDKDDTVLGRTGSMFDGIFEYLLGAIKETSSV